MQAIIIVFEEENQVKSIPKPDGKPGEKIKDYWDYAKKKFLNNKLKARFLSYTEDTIPKLKNVP